MSESRTRYVLEPRSEEVDLGAATRPPTDMEITLEGSTPADLPTEHAALSAEEAAAVFAHGDPTAALDFETFKADPELADEGPEAIALPAPAPHPHESPLDVVELPALEGKAPRELEPDEPYPDLAEQLDPVLENDDAAFALPPVPRPLEDTGPPSPPSFLHSVVPPAANRAARADSVRPSIADEPHLLFTLDQALCAIALGQILEVIPCRSLSPVSGGPSWLLGRTTHAGQQIPVLSLRRLFQLPHGDAVAARRWLVVQSQDDKKRRVCLEVDRVDGVRRFTAALAALASPLSLQTGIYLLAAMELQSEVVSCLDVERIVRETEAAWNGNE